MRYDGKSLEHSATYHRIYSVVAKIPKGSVATYGQIAAMAGCSGPRQVGYALHALPNHSHVPWHRVINTKGLISLPPGSDSAEIQRTLLEAEGIRFDPTGKMSLKQYRWKPRQVRSKFVNDLRI